MELCFNTEPIKVMINSDTHWLPEDVAKQSDMFKVLFEVSDRPTPPVFTIPHNHLIPTVFRFITSEKSSLIDSISNTTDMIKLIQIMDIAGFKKELIEKSSEFFTKRYVKIFDEDPTGSKIANSSELEEFFTVCFQSKITDEKDTEHIVCDDHVSQLIRHFFKNINNHENQPRKAIFDLLWNILKKRNIDMIFLKNRFIKFMTWCIYHCVDGYLLCTHYVYNYNIYHGIKPDRVSGGDRFQDDVIALYKTYVNKDVVSPAVIITSKSYDPMDMNIQIKISNTKFLPINKNDINWGSAGCCVNLDNALAPHLVDILLGLDDVG